MIADYRATGLSLKTHPLRFLRPRLAAEGVLSCAEAVGKPAGARVQVAGLVLVRQRPGGGEVVFITLEDETGIGNIVVWASILETFRREVIGSSLLLVHGRVQRSAAPRMSPTSSPKFWKTGVPRWPTSRKLAPPSPAPSARRAHHTPFSRFSLTEKDLRAIVE